MIHLIILSIIALTACASAQKGAEITPQLERRTPSQVTKQVAKLYLKTNYDQFTGAKNLLKLKYGKDAARKMKISSEVKASILARARIMATVRSFAEKINPQLRLQPKFSYSKSYLENLKHQFTIDQKRTLIRKVIRGHLKEIFGDDGVAKSVPMMRKDLEGWPESVPIKPLNQLNPQELDQVILNLDRIYPSESFIRKN